LLKLAEAEPRGCCIYTISSKFWKHYWNLEQEKRNNFKNVKEVVNFT